MASPHATPRYPGVPHTTPASSVASRKIPRAPILNPFDQFPKNEFDAFINDITGKLKRALGREEPVDLLRESALPRDRDSPTREGQDDDELLEDSFAEVKARRLAKGKERAVEDEEGSETTPIEVQSDSEDSQDDDSIFDSHWGEHEEGVEYDDDDQAYGDGEHEYEHNAGQEAHADVIEVLSDDDEEEQPHEDSEEEHASHYDLEPKTYVDYNEESDELLEDEDENVDSFPPPSRAAQPADLNDPWSGVATYAEDFYSGGDICGSPKTTKTINPDILPPEEADDEIEVIEIDDEDNNDEMPPVELPDPWVGPRTYMEDFYSGGEVIDHKRGMRDVSPSSLTPVHDDEDSPTRPDSLTFGMDESGLAAPNSSADKAADLHTTSPLTEVPSDEVRQSTQPELTDDIEGGLEEDIDVESRHTIFQQEFVEKRSSTPRRSPPSRDRHERSPSPLGPSLTGHVDWNWPPAFNSGRLATRPGHLMSPDYDNDSAAYDLSAIHDDDLVMLNTLPGNAVVDASTDEHRGLDEPDDTINGKDITPQLSESVTVSSIHTNRETVHEGVSSADLYGEFDPLYMTTEDISDLKDNIISSEHREEVAFEPVNVEDADFGDLPDISSVQSEVLSTEAESSRPLVTEGLPQLTEDSDTTRSPPALEVEETDIVFSETNSNADAPSIADANGSDVNVIGSGGQMAETAEVQDDIVDVDADESTPAEYLVEEPITEGRRTEEPEVRPSDRAQSLELLDAAAMEDAYINRDYHVQEPATERSHEPEPNVEDNVLDIAAHADESEYLVEEPITEGRRTEEPEARPFDRAQSFELIDASATMKDEDVHINRDYSVEEADIMRYQTPERSIHDDVPKSSPSAPHTNSCETLSNGEPKISMSAGSIDKSPSHSTPYPMPVSADPNVPDPASTPSPPRSSSPLDVKATLSVPSRSPAHASRALSPAMEAALSMMPNIARSPLMRSIRGLFTPLTDSTPSPASPVVSDKELAGDTDNSYPSIIDVDVVSPTEILNTDDGSSAPVDNAVGLSDDQPRASHHDGDMTTPLIQSEPAEDTRIEVLATMESNDMNEVESVEDTTRTAPKSHPESPSKASTSDHDEDADGDIDTEYVARIQLAQSNVSHDDSPAAHDDSTVDRLDTTSQDNALTQITTNESTLEHQEDKDQALINIDNAEAINTEKDATFSKLPDLPPDSVTNDVQIPEVKDDIIPEVQSPATSSIDAATAIPPEDKIETLVSSDSIQDARPLKRKRKVPASLIPRLTRSMSVKHAGDPKPKPPSSTVRTKNGKGKGKEERPDNDDNSDVVSTSSGASVASKMLEPLSQATSRASSVGSQASSNASSSRQLSPTLNLLPGRSVPPSSFIHAHGVLHHHHGRPLAVAPTQAPPPESHRQQSPSIRAASLSPSVASTRQASAEQDPLPSTPSTTTSSPVTRSNCRFHKISIPRGNGSRLYFVVPGCSLSNRELMEEEHIEDHGNATIRDQSHLVGDVESLHLGSESIGVLRQLVGVDLLREQEVFFLPQPGQKYRDQSQRKSGLGRPRESISVRSRRGNSPGPSEAPRISVGRLAGSRDSASISSASASGRISERGSITPTASISGSDLSDLEDDRTPKKPKVKPVDVDIAAPDADTGSTSNNASKVEPPLKPRRSKRLGVDASAYVPDADHSGDDSATDHTAKGGKRKRSTRGIKRSRQEETTEGQEDGQGGTRKKRKVRSNLSGRRKKMRTDTQDVQ